MENRRFEHITKNNVNLLVSLYFLLKERKVTNAARNINLDQPSMSAHLAKLRIIFEDKLLIKTNGEMMMTPFAHEVYPQLRSVLLDIERFLGATAAQEEKLTPGGRVYKICLQDDVFIKKITTPLYECIQKLNENNKVVFEIIKYNKHSIDELNNGLIHLFFGRGEGVSNNIHSQTLGKSRWYWAVNDKHRLAGKNITPHELQEETYVDITNLKQVINTTYAAFSSALDTMACRLKISSISSAIHFVKNNNVLCFLPEHLIREHDLSIVKLKMMDDMELINHMCWHKAMDNDAFLKQLRDEVSNQFHYPYNAMDEY